MGVLELVGRDGTLNLFGFLKGLFKVADGVFAFTVEKKMVKSIIKSAPGVVLHFGHELVGTPLRPFVVIDVRLLLSGLKLLNLMLKGRLVLTDGTKGRVQG